MKKIADSQELYPSTEANHPKDAIYGDGQYLTGIRPGTKTQGQLARALIGVPRGRAKFTHCGDRHDGTRSLRETPRVFYIPNSGSLDLTGLIAGSGANWACGT